MLTDDLRSRKYSLEHIIETAEKALKKAPKGSLRIAHKHNTPQYYFCEEGSITYKYLSKKKMPLITALAQSQYHSKILALAKKELKKVNDLLAVRQNGIAEDVYKKYKKDRQKLIKPIQDTDEEYIEKWLQVDYSKKEFTEDFPDYITNKGERVRSKSEVIIANTLYEEKIPYRYEYPIMINGILLHPDFTVLDIRHRKEFLWEHLGMMDDPDYAASALNRILLLENANYFPGCNLIITHETSQKPLNTRLLRKMIHTYFK